MWFLKKDLEAGAVDGVDGPHCIWLVEVELEVMAPLSSEGG